MDRTVDATAQVSPPRRNCNGCDRSLRDGRSFVFKVNSALSAPGIAAQVSETPKCILCAIRHVPMVRRSLMVAAVVGTTLTLLNHGDTLAARDWPTALYWKIPLTYCVPFLVATFGALTNIRR